MGSISERVYDHDCSIGFVVYSPRIPVKKGDTVQAIRRYEWSKYPNELKVIRQDGSEETITKEAVISWIVKEYPPST